MTRQLDNCQRQQDYMTRHLEIYHPPKEYMTRQLENDHLLIRLYDKTIRQLLSPDSVI